MTHPNSRLPVALLVAGAILLTIFAKAIYERVTVRPLQQIMEWRLPANTDGHSESVATDGVYLYWSSVNRILKAYSDNPDWEHPIAVNTHAREDGTPVQQINGLAIENEYLYASAPTGVGIDNPRFFVKWYDTETLEFVGERELFWDGAGDTQECIAYHDGYWWTCYFDRAVVSLYDRDFRFVVSVELPPAPRQQGRNIQGMSWRDNQLWAATTETIRVYDWDAGARKLTLAKRYKKAIQQNTLQGFAFSPDGRYIYWADFDDEHEILHKLLAPGVVR